MSGIILAIGRCAEDTAVIMLTGVVATAGVPRSLLSPLEFQERCTLLVVSHYLDQVKRIADRVVQLSEGRLISYE